METPLGFPYDTGLLLLNSNRGRQCNKNTFAKARIVRIFQSPRQMKESHSPGPRLECSSLNHRTSPRYRQYHLSRWGNLCQLLTKDRSQFPPLSRSTYGTNICSVCSVVLLHNGLSHKEQIQAANDIRLVSRL